MKIAALEKSTALTFGLSQAAELLSLNSASTKVTLSRYVKKGYLLRLKRGEYILKSRWERLERPELFQIANRMQVPSYVSLTSALAFYGLTTQIPMNVVESIAVIRTARIEVQDVTFRYFKIRSFLFRDFVKREDIFIAKPEKALLDAWYLKSLGRYRPDLSAIDLSRFDRRELLRCAKAFHDLPIGDLIKK